MKVNTTILLLSLYNILISLLVALFSSYIYKNLGLAVGGIALCMALFTLGPLLSASYIETGIYKYLLSATISIGTFMGFLVTSQPTIGLLLSIISFVILILTAKDISKIYKNQVKLDIKIVFERYILTAMFVFAIVGAACLLTHHPEIEGKLIQEVNVRIENYFKNNLLGPFNIFGRDIQINAAIIGMDKRVNFVVIQKIKEYSIYIVAVLSLVTLLGLGTLSRVVWFFVNPLYVLGYKFLIKKGFYQVEVVTVEKQILTRKAGE